ncbi:MAG: bifunctional non-ous end joining protein LigD [Methylobacteriaceae bacterium]|nr:bifunctional non-ous end joining protein LigD [Methylobacteriaceae bacterium]
MAEKQVLNREEFIVVGWTDPEGSRPHIWRSLARILRARWPAGLCGSPPARQCRKRELARLLARLKPLATDRMPIDIAPPRTSRFGSPVVLSRAHWIRPERLVVYQGAREDKPGSEVRRDWPHVP